MAWAKGESGNPLGWIAQQQFTTELRRQLKVAYGKRKRPRLEVIAEKLALKACAGEPWAINMVADRIDGKALAQVSANIGVDATSLFVEVLKRISQGEFRDNDAGAKLIEHEGKADKDGVA